jgi:hypothetical protein
MRRGHESSNGGVPLVHSPFHRTPSMLTTLEVVLHQAPAVLAVEQSTNAISSFLGPPPNLSLSEACAFGSLELLEWIWSSSCPDPDSRTPWWSLHNFLRSDPHYHSWQFSKSLEVALARGDVAMVEWIFAHFSGCEAPATVADRAIENGNLRVLATLRKLRSNPEGGDDQGPECTVQTGRLWNTTTIQKACENGQLSQCLDDGMQLDEDDRETAIKYALKLGDTALIERLLPTGRCLLDYAAGCPRVEVIEWMLDCGYLRRDERLAARTMPGLASSGRLDLMRQVLQLHSPLPSVHEAWVDAWIDAIEEACSCGNDVILQWLLGQPVALETVDRLRAEHRNLFLDAVASGYTQVMESLYSHLLCGDFFSGVELRRAVKEGQLKSLRWLLAHYPVEKMKLHGGVVDMAAQYGHVELLQFFHDMDAADFEASRSKRRRTNSWWSSAEDPIYWAARGGHLAVLQWIQANRSQQCGVDAMDAAVGEGHLEVVKWLHANRSEGCSSRAMCNAAEHGHLHVVKWLYAHRPESRTHLAIDRAVRFGHTRIVCWLQPLFPEYKIGSQLEGLKSLVNVDGSWDSGNTFEVLLCLHVRYGYVFTP